MGQISKLKIQNSEFIFGFTWENWVEMEAAVFAARLTTNTEKKMIERKRLKETLSKEDMEKIVIQS